MTPSPRRRVWRSRLLVVGLLVLVAGGLLTWALVGGRSAQRLQAELDRDEPGWRWATLQAEYERQLPPLGTSPMRFVGLAGPGAKPYCDWLNARTPTGNDWLPPAEPNRRPPGRLLAGTRCIRDDAEPALLLLRPLATHPGPGGTWLTFSPDGIGTLLPHLNTVREVGELLRLDAVTAALADDPEHAVHSTRAGLGVARAVGPEPFFASIAVRRWAGRQAVDALERTLALAEPADGLAELQAELLAEADGPATLAAARSERAILNEMYDNFRSGRDSLPAFIARYGIAAPGPVQLHDLRFRFQIAGEQVRVLNHATALVRAAEAPEHERLAHVDRLPPFDVGRSPVARLLTGFSQQGLDFRRMFELDLHGKARLRAAAVGVACERFRQQHGRWPDELSELGPLLPNVPNDPFTGRPLVYHRVPGGAVVYAIGPDGTDDGGNLADDAGYHPVRSAGLDIGFRLFDPDRRNLPPAVEDDP